LRPSPAQIAVLACTSIQGLPLLAPAACTATRLWAQQSTVVDQVDEQIQSRAKQFRHLGSSLLFLKEARSPLGFDRPEEMLGPLIASRKLAVNLMYGISNC
jgi:hypothetical protein